MAIRFRFRSSANYDSVLIEGQPSISIRDLKAKIVNNKNLNICQDFDLVFSDAETGQEYYDENIQLPSGSSVIIKRVPAGSARADIGHVKSLENIRIKETNMVRTSPQANVEVDNFDDFGVELCPIPEATISGSDLDLVVDKQFCTTNDEIPRYFEISRVGCQKLEASELIEAIPTRPLNIGDNEDISPKKMVTANPRAMQNVDLPAELKCSLCDTFFKEAMMIPCCQHSFCEKCIRLVLTEKRRCPKCLSTKYTVEDLLPNVSLRQAIEHFLESQILIRSSDNAFGYAPDGESGIQVKEMSCAVSIHQKEAVLPHSPCATGRGSNQIIGKSVGGKSLLRHKLKETDAGKHGPRHPVDSDRGTEDLVSDFQGENQPMHEEAESTMKKKASWVNTAGVDRSFVEMGRHRKAQGDRTCFMCGSPDHFIRDCPAASSPHPMLQTGNAMFPGATPGFLSPWGSFPQIRPLLSPYGNPYAPAIFPPTTFAVPTYMPSMFGGVAPYGGFTRVGGLACPVGPSAEWHVDRSDGQELQGYEKRQKVSHNNLGRRQSFDYDEDASFNKRHNETERSPGLRTHRDGGRSASHSRDSFTDRPRRKHRHHVSFDYELERSSSEVEDMPSSSNWHSEVQLKHHHRNSKKHDGGIVHIGGDSRHSHRQHQTQSKPKDIKRMRVASEGKRDERKHHSQSESGLQPSLSSDHKTQWKERDCSYGSRHSRHNSRSMNNDPSHERWQMVSGSDEDGDEDHHYYKRKRLH